MHLRDQQLFQIALITALVGIVGMIIFGNNISPRNIKIEELNPGMMDEEVSIEGLVEKVDKVYKSETYFLTINDGTGKTKVVIFEGTVIEIENKGFKLEYFHQKKIKATGRVTEYKGQLELIIEDSTSLKILS